MDETNRAGMFHFPVPAPFLSPIAVPASDSATRRAPRCPRCHGQLLQDWDELTGLELACLNCGWRRRRLARPAS